MRVPENFRKCVVFVGVEKETPAGKSEIKYCGTAFFVSVPSLSRQGVHFMYLVTARHVAVDIGDRPFYVRANSNDGRSMVIASTVDSKWHYYPREDESCDLAVMPFGIPEGSMVLMDYKTLKTEILLTDMLVDEFNVGEGDEVVIIGLFSYHHGNSRNFPIVRTGNIALMPGEPVHCKHFGNMEAYLIEARSLGGMSGSPVFVLKPAPGGARVFLLGLIHGHWEIGPERLLDVDTPDKETKPQSINTGIAIVVPAKKILDTLNHEPLAKLRSELENHLKKSQDNSAGEQSH